MTILPQKLNIILFLKGITKTPISKMGMKASDTAILAFEDVRVPLANTVGEEGQGFRYQMLQFQVPWQTAYQFCAV
jgi:alkylation response protein AidB-like acyl-CoA dehydrogenase